MGVDPAIAQLIDDPPRPVLFHTHKIIARPE
jgi:hypothetical protein